MELFKNRENTGLFTKSPSGDMLFGDKTSKEVVAEDKNYKEQMLNEETK